MYNYYENMRKAENPQKYKELAEKGIMLAHPVSIAGKTHRSDINLPYHSSIKVFHSENDSPQAAHDIASKMNFHKPDPKTTTIHPETFKDRFGNDVHVLKLKGPSADKIKEHNSKFAHMGYPAKHDFQAHISVEKPQWDKIKASGAKTAHDAGISFGDAQLHQGHKVLQTYKKSESQENPLLKHFSSKKLPVHIAKETIAMSPSLKKSHGKAVLLKDEDFNNYVQDNPGLQHEIANQHLNRIEHHFGHDPDMVFHGWVNGIKEAYKVKKQKYKKE